VNHLFKTAAVFSIAAGAAFAQDVVYFAQGQQEELPKLRMLAQAQQEDMAKMKVQLSGSVMGPAVKGAPYSGEEVNSSTQVLADGTRIHRENKTTVYRDSEGRVRRETPDQITIMDPVAGVSYFLNPKTMTAQKAPVMMNRVFRFNADGVPGSLVRTESSFTMTTTRDGATSAVINGTPVDPKVLAEAIAKAKEQGEAVTSAGGIVLEKTIRDEADARVQKLDAEKGAVNMAVKFDARGKSEDLGKSTIEGVAAEGTRNTSTIETGSIGNDRPIQIVTERWYSPELQTVLSTKTTDPRMGEISFQLTNVHRGDPGAYLFQVPSGYTVSERK
jgi:hypothetical protein